MRSLQHIEKPVRNLQVEYFNHNDLANLIFHSVFPIYQDKPLLEISNLPFKDILITFSLSLLSKEEDSIIDILKRSIKYVGEKEVNNLEFLDTFPRWAINLLFNSYSKGMELWAEYLDKELQDFCKTDFSKLQWEVVVRGGINFLFTPPLRYEQKLWVAINSMIEKNEQREFLIDIRESLLPWINNELWHAIKKNEDKKRVNVAYDEQRKKLFEGDLEELDVIR